MNELKIFENNQFGRIRVQERNNEAWFCLKDVCDILDINNVSQLKTRLKEDGVITNEVIDNLGRKQDANFINESNLYKVIFQSRKESAEKFTDWVTSEVLPSIRKHGAYLTDDKIEEVLSNPDTIIRLAMDLKTERERRRQLELENAQNTQLIGELKPKVDYLDRILQNKGLVTITAIAKDYGMSGEKLNDKLHELGVQYKQSKQWFLYSKYHNCGYTHSETIDLKHKDGTDFVRLNTKWTQKGRLFLYDLLKENNLVPVIEKEEVKING